MQQLLTRTVTFIVALTVSAALCFAAEPAKPAAKPVPAKVEAAKPAETKTTKQELIDINSASDAELKTLPGIGDATIAKIVVNRPYANKSQLVSKKVLPEAVYEKIKDRIIAKQAKKDDKKTEPKAAAKPEPKKK